MATSLAGSTAEEPDHFAERELRIQRARAISTIPPALRQTRSLPVVIWLHGYSYQLGYMWVYHNDLHPILALVKAGTRSLHSIRAVSGAG